MPRPLRLEFENAFYHITVRGNNKKTIFDNDDDNERFIAQLQRTLKSYQVILFAYVLMKNHFHLLIKTPLANLSRFMQRLNTSYSMYYRYKHKRPGHCFQGRFGAKIIQDDTYLKTLSRYIHLNPVKVKNISKLSAKEKIQYLKEYKWSSLPGYLDKNHAEDFVCYDILKTFSADSRKAGGLYETYIYERIDDSEKNELIEMSSWAIGDDNYITLIENEIKLHKNGHYDCYDLYLPKVKKTSMEFIERKVCEVFGIRADILRKDKRISGNAKDIAIELSSRYTGQSMRKVAVYYGLKSSSSIQNVRRRFEENGLEKTKEFKELKRLIEEKK